MTSFLNYKQKLIIVSDLNLENRIFLHFLESYQIWKIHVATQGEHPYASLAATKTGYVLLIEAINCSAAGEASQKYWKVSVN